MEAISSLVAAVARTMTALARAISLLVSAVTLPLMLRASSPSRKKTTQKLFELIKNGSLLLIDFHHAMSDCCGFRFIEPKNFCAFKFTDN